MRKEPDIHFSLGFVLQLTDTTTGRPVSDRGPEISVDGIGQRFVSKEPGVFAVMYDGEKNCQITVKTAGYYKKTAQIQLDDRPLEIPVVDLSMVPGNNDPIFCELRGKKTGLDSIMGIPYSSWNLRVKNYDPETGRMKLFNPHKVPTRQTEYGLINLDKKCFEILKVIREIDAETVVLAEKLRPIFIENAPVARIISGWVGEDGTYVFRVRKRREAEEYLMRYQVRGKEYYDIKTLI